MVHKKKYSTKSNTKHNVIEKSSLMLTGGLLVTTLCTGMMLGSARTNADDIVDDITITVPVSCTMSGTGMTSHTASITNGTYQGDIGTTTLKAFCNDNEGFAIYAAGYTGEEVGGTNSTKLVGTPAAIGNIDTGIAESGNTSNWAMKLATNASATYALELDNGYNNYSIVPSDYVKVAHRDSATDIPSSNTTATGAELTTTYAAYISQTQPAGTYSGKVIYTLVHPASHAAPVVCKPSATTADTALCMQDFAGPNHDAIIASMTPGQQYTMKDSRDGKTYTIAKYQVGNTGNYDVWMTQNLDLDLVAGTTYTNEDTDIGYNTTTGQYGTAAWSPSASTLAAGSSGWTMSTTTPESYDPGDLYWNGTESDYSDWGAYYNTCSWNETTGATENCDESLNPLPTYTTTTSSTPQYHLGNYYNWTAAIAMNDSSEKTSSTEIIEQSICPAGWTLPRIGTGEDTFYSLWNQYGMASSSYIDTDGDETHDSNESALWTSPLYFAAGGYYGGTLGGVGSDGYFWSPVADGSYDARGAYFGVDGGASPSGLSDRGGGISVRCIARPVVTSESDGGGGGGNSPYV